MAYRKHDVRTWPYGVRNPWKECYRPRNVHSLARNVCSTSPGLVYGMEVVFPKATLVEKLEKNYKQLIKHILSLPVTVADPAVYVLSGSLPIEAALVLFGSLQTQCGFGGEATGAQATAIKTFEIISWFVAVRKLFFKYSLTVKIQ